MSVILKGYGDLTRFQGGLYKLQEFHLTWDLPAAVWNLKILLDVMSLQWMKP